MIPGWRFDSGSQFKTDSGLNEYESEHYFQAFAQVFSVPHHD